jgi:hypothetical protein
MLPYGSFYGPATVVHPSGPTVKIFSVALMEDSCFLLFGVVGPALQLMLVRVPGPRLMTKLS